LPSIDRRKAASVLLCDAESMAALANWVSNVLGTRLHLNHSPMDGAWYSSIDLTALIQAIKAGKSDPGSIYKTFTDADPEITLTLNDPEPGRTAPTYSGGAAFILSIEGSPAVVTNTEGKLVAAGAGTVRRK
jgi:hypothetical protein